MRFWRKNFNHEADRYDAAAARARAAISLLRSQREPDLGAGAYDMVDQEQITILIDAVEVILEAERLSA